MCAALYHRGPDDGGEMYRGGVALGMRRLSIIDIEGGHQPMTTKDGVSIVFNGEIYNHAALREELTREGERFATRSDTEVVLRLYRRHGIGAIDRLQGMFAIALHDTRSEQLHLIRDRLGKKPLYYGHPQGRFMFASELKAILAALKVRPALDHVSLSHFLTLRYVPAPNTIWEGLSKLEPGHRLTLDLDSGRHEIVRWWRVEFASQSLIEGRDYLGEFNALFEDAVDKRLLAADVPVGVLLSGGLDSSAVSAAAVERGHDEFHTFSVGYEGGGPHSELAWAQTMADSIGSKHHEVVLGLDDFVTGVDELVWATDEPLADLASIPLGHVARLARENVKVVLSGEGADEVLGGYDMEVLAGRLRKLRLLDRLPRSALGALARISPPARAEALRALARGGRGGFLRETTSHITHGWSDGDKQRLLLQQPAAETDPLIQTWYRATASPEPIDQLQEVYCGSWLVEDLLMKADKMTMANSLELRTPFLDHRLVEWAATLPLEWKIGTATHPVSKRILREWASTRIPTAIVNRPKQGFPVPAYSWLSDDPLSSWAEAQILGTGSPLAEVIDQAVAKPALAAARAGDRNAGERVWSLIVLGHWMKRWL